VASTLTKILLHVTFSTKGRAPMIPERIESDLYAYVGGICRGRDSRLLAIGGTADHVHMMVGLGKTVALSDLMLNVKRDSSKWIKEKDAALGAFGWQDGYFAFSIGESGVDGLRAYIASQKEHHKTIDFKDEVRAFLRKYGIEWDERYVWD
jgi:putative transposase